jgi:hypothetical protein
MTSSREEELASVVISYLTEHPQAMDTVKGIAEWWVVSRQVSVEAEILASVLQKLVDQGYLEKVDSSSGPLYRLRRYTG